MKKYLAGPVMTLLLAGFLNAAAAEESAVVTESRLNVRGQPSLLGEVVTQLQKGEVVTIIDHVTPEKPKPGEPTNWARIKMPANTPVWVFAPLLKDHKVAASKLNLRAGPGENYSVLGRLKKGDDVKEIRTVEDWTEIETPENTYAFVDAKFLKPGGPELAEKKPAEAPPAAAVPPAAAESKPAEPKPAEPVAVKDEPKPEETKPPVVEPVKPQEAIAEPKDIAPAKPESAPVVPLAAPPAAAVATESPKLPEVAPAPERPPTETPLPRRIVRREGVVRTTRSIQAPTYYELINPESKKVINYLHTEGLDVNLKKFRGQRIIVTGEEALDRRWPNTPVIEVETVETAP